MVDHPRPDELAVLRAEVAALRDRMDRPRHRAATTTPGRLTALVLVALLAALLPVSLLAAGPTFSDLGDAAAVHQPNIQAIGDANITTGFEDPNNPSARLYNPKGQVTREEMASFLARTAGLGTNAPVANAKTATTAQNAVNAVNATTAQTAALATNATNATNTGQLGGQPASAYLRATGDTTLRYPGATALLVSGSGVTFAPNVRGGATLTTSTVGGWEIIIPLPRPTASFGVNLAVARVRVCFSTSDTADVHISSTQLYYNERGLADDTLLVTDLAHRTTAGHNVAACYDVAVPTPVAVAGQLYLYIFVSKSSTTAQSVRFTSVALTLTPTAAGTAELVPSGGGDPKPTP